MDWCVSDATTGTVVSSRLTNAGVAEVPPLLHYQSQAVFMNTNEYFKRVAPFLRPRMLRRKKVMVVGQGYSRSVGPLGSLDAGPLGRF
jgi:hypothetical protein